MEMGTHNLPTPSVQRLIDTAATSMQRRFALTLCIILALVVLCTLPYAHTPFIKFPVFVAYYTAFVLFADLFTVFLLFGQFLRTRTLSFAPLATAYLFTSLIVVPYALTFPDIIPTNSLLNANTQAASWLWIFWHAGFPLGVVIYGIIDAQYEALSLTPRQVRAISLSLILFTFVVVVALTILAIDPYHLLPILIVHGDFSRINTSGIGPVLLILNIAACIASILRARRGSIIQIWLSVAAFTYLLNVTLNLWAGSRYSIGWYLARTNSITASAVVLCALMYEVNHLYAKIAWQNKQLEQQNEHLEQQNTLQRNFVSTVSHEFRTALTIIQGFSELIYEEDLSAEEIKEYANDMNQEAERLARLITDLLDLDRMRAGNSKLHMQQLDLNTLVEEVAHRMHSISERHTLRLDLECGDHRLSGDQDKLIQVITNLISNAIKYSPEGGEVVLKSRREGTTMHVSVQDHGIGIPPDKLEGVFERYTRVEAEHTRYVGGTGLGLSIVRQIVELHGGKAWAESSVGTGSIFHVVLPVIHVAVLVQG